MKKIIAVFLAVTIFCLTGCSSQSYTFDDMKNMSVDSSVVNNKITQYINWGHEEDVLENYQILLNYLDNYDIDYKILTMNINGLFNAVGGLTDINNYVLQVIPVECNQMLKYYDINGVSEDPLYNWGPTIGYNVTTDIISSRFENSIVFINWLNSLKAEIENKFPGSYVSCLNAWKSTYVSDPLSHDLSDWEWFLQNPEELGGENQSYLPLNSSISVILPSNSTKEDAEEVHSFVNGISDKYQLYSDNPEISNLYVTIPESDEYKDALIEDSTLVNDDEALYYEQEVYNFRFEAK